MIREIQTEIGDKPKSTMETHEGKGDRREHTIACKKTDSSGCSQLLVKQCHPRTGVIRNLNPPVLVTQPS